MYEPGSTSKVMSIAAVLEEGAATPDTHVTVPNRLHRGDRLFRDDVDHPTWYLTLNGVLAKSSNIGTILATGQLGKTQPEANKVLYSYLRKFGLGSTTGLDYPGESPGIVAKPQDWSTSQQYTIPFGQGLSSTPCRPPRCTRPSPTAGSGSSPPSSAGPRTRAAATPRRTPRSGPGWSARRRPEPWRRCWSPSWTTGRAPAPRPTSRATGSPAKMGTANRVDPVRGVYKGYTASFAGFAPADDPQVTVYCAIQNPTEGSYFGGQICGPIYKKVMEFALKTLQTPPSGKAPARLPVSFKPGE